MTEPLSPDYAEQYAGDVLDDAVPSSGYALTPLVGLGGSAGAIPALQQFFRSVPPDAGLAFVVILHLSPDHVSELSELLQRCTRMPVAQLQGRTRVQPNHIYVIPPRHAMHAGPGWLQLAPLDDESGRRLTVDLFLRTLADTHGAHAAAVILSGADGDGTIGLKRIKERGGLTIAQDPEECEHPSMPRSAIATGMVDWVLPVAEIAPRLLAYFRLEKHLRLPAEEPPAQQAAGADQDEAGLRDVLSFLRTRTGRDFTGYKRATIVRRIARRMQVNGTDHLHGYLQCLRTRPGEAAALLQDLLISVTNFFRDSDAFLALDAHLGEMFKGRGPSDTLRVWVPACATGEEAYSLAILLCERARQSDGPPQIQLFATDLDEEAIRVGREAIYPTTIEADVSEDLLRRYFVKESRGYRVRREIREMVLFAQHDVLKDSPFSRLDLISCRNLLIYLSREAQQRVFQTFHFALRPSGHLFLGTSESAEDATSLFTVVDKKHRIFMQRPLPRSALPVPQGPGTLALSLELQARVEDSPAIGGRAFQQPPTPSRSVRAVEGRSTSWAELHFKLLEALAPPSVLVDAEHEILHLSPSAGRFLQFTGGEPSRNLLRTVHPALRIELRAALYKAAQTRSTAQVVAGPVPLGDEQLEVEIRTLVLAESGADLFVVTFAPRARSAAGQLGAGADTAPEADPVARHLDRELERLKTHLRDTVEQYEASNEELKASNEELQAMNEELRSATEELETSREELQSINEELSTVNQELKSKVDELAGANSDIHNLMDATQIATIFLDRDLRVMRYTPSAVGLFSLINSDIGRPLADLASRLEYPQLSTDAQRVLERLVPIEREVGLPDGSWFLTRLLPYRTLEDRIAGVVLSFIDITERKHAEEVRMWLSSAVASLHDSVISFSLDRTILSWNMGAQQTFGWTADDAIGQPLSMLSPGREREQDEWFGSLEQGKPVTGAERTWRRADGTEVVVSLSISPIKDADGRLIGGTAVVRDVTEARAAAEAVRASEERLRLVVENAREYAIFSLDLERRVTSWNNGAERLLGYSEEEALGQAGDMIFTPEDRAAGAPEQETHEARAQGRAADDRVHQRKDGSRFWASGVAMLMRDAAGNEIGFVKILRDQTDERKSREALEASQAELVSALAENQRARRELEAADSAKDRFLAVLSHELRNPLASIASASELLLVPRLPEAALEKAAHVVSRQAKAMKVLLDELLDVSRLTLGRLTLQRRPVSVAAVIQNALETTRPLVQAANHELTLKLPTEQIEIDADPLRLAQVVSNLVSNAAKYTPEGGRIEVSAELLGDEVVVTVQDNGIGMDPAQIDRMFDLFTQGEGAAGHASGGLGIGLALSRNIIEMHGGWILASSAGSGRGSQLRIGLPVLSHRAAPPPTPAPVVLPLTPASAAEGELVLVADDNGDAAWGMAKLLELSGFRAIMARGGEEALKMAEQHRPAIALLDIGMPDLSGHEVARRLRKQPWGRAMILIAATGWGQESDIKLSMEAGFDAHLTKPLNVGRIRSLLDELGRRK